MAIGDPKIDKSSRRKGRRRTNKSGASKNYSPGFFEMAITFLNKTPREAGLFDASPKSAKGRAAAKKKKEAKKNLDRDIVKAREKRDINLIVNRAEKAQKKKDDFKGEDAAPSKSSGKKLSKFQQAFADARKAGKRTFRFTNNAGKTTTYTTRLQTESKDAFEKKFKKGNK